MHKNPLLELTAAQTVRALLLTNLSKHNYQVSLISSTGLHKDISFFTPPEKALHNSVIHFPNLSHQFTPLSAVTDSHNGTP